mmetsp:Transcript_27300/g.84190  ORF Transcript_27300/g.84190 Transcript_27300/m.84190 type:complete len:334 (+) Transcript_27300:86-1087(+)
MSCALKVAITVVDGDCPSARGGHSATTAENQIVIFGGSAYTTGGRFAYYNDTHVLDAENRVWHNVQCSGEVPTPRYGHSVELIGSRMFVFGGRGEIGTLRDVCFLDLVEWSWVSVSVTSAGPSPRFFHASLLVGRKIVVHGGWDGHMRCMGDLWVFNTDTFTWLQPKCAGILPSPRYGHSLNLLANGCIICFGGCALSTSDPIPEYYNDLRQLDTESMLWSKPINHGTYTPSKRSGHTTTTLGSRLVVFGGWGAGGMQNMDCKQQGSGSVYVLNMSASSNEWLMPRTAASFAHRYGHTTTRVGTKIYIFGGWNGKQATSDLLEAYLALSGSDI